MKKLFFIIFLTPLILYSEEYILVKQIWGKVNLIHHNDKVTDLVAYSTIKANQQIELMGIESKVWIRNNKNEDIIIEFDNVNKYSYGDIKLLVEANRNTETKNKSFVNQFFSLISMPTKKNKTQINGMMLSSKTGVSRNINDTNIILIKDIVVLEGMPFKVNFSNFFDFSGAMYNSTIHDKWTKKRLYELETIVPYFEIENKNIEGSLGINWELKITNSKTKKVLLCNISSLFLTFETQNLLDNLKQEALNEIGTEENLFQSIFIEVLLSKELFTSALYYRELFNIDY